MTEYDLGLGRVFKPDPLTTATHYYGTDGYIDNNDNDHSALNGERITVTLMDIEDSGGLYRLNGPYVTIRDFETPTVAPVTSSDGLFVYTRSPSGFEDVMVYYHIDNSQRYIQSMGFTNIQNGSIWVDPHGLNGADNSHYLPGTNRIAFGEGNVDDAEDADVIWHEYGHAIQHAQISGTFGYELNCIGEGFGDYWAGSYSASISSWERDFVFTWDAGITSSGSGSIWSGRRLDENYTYNDYNSLPGVHNKGKIWSATLWDIRNALGRDIGDKLVIESHYNLINTATMLDAANAILTADQDIPEYDGVHLPTLTPIFEARDFDVPPAPPQNLQLSGGFLEHPTLTWDANTEPDIYRYYVYRRVEGEGGWSNIGWTTNTTFTDNQVTIGIPDSYFSYYVKARDTAGQNSPASNTVGVWGLWKQGIPAKEMVDLPQAFELEGNHPNPFNPVTTIRYDLPEWSFVELRIYDLMGRQTRTLVSGNKDAGYQSVMWDGKDSGGNSVPSGMYFCRLDAISYESDKEFHQTRKMILLR